MGRRRWKLCVAAGAYLALIACVPWGREWLWHGLVFLAGVPMFFGIAAYLAYGLGEWLS